MPEASIEANGRIPLDLSIYGPGYSGLHNLQRKILKGRAYKNWRLDGEYINNPESEPERYNILKAGDFAIFEFRGPVIPVSAKLVLVSQALHIDQPLHRELAVLMSGHSMVTVSVAQLQAISSRIKDNAHPFHELTLDAELEDAALGGTRGVLALRRRPGKRTVSREELERARRLAEEVGKTGEELVCQHLIQLKTAGAIKDFTWASDANAVAPYDFLVILPNDQEVAIDVKSTSGEFERPIHISANELVEMSNRNRYDIYRVFGATENSGILRIAEDVGTFAKTILVCTNRLPAGVRMDSVSVDTSSLNFDTAVQLTAPTTEEPNPA